ncbi:MAG: hypothetical protein LUF82_06760 [Clostridia bacterium]|nr:hypothetical protein [Clostridia bacterium]
MEFKQIKKGKIILFTGEGVLIFSLVPVLAGLFLYLLDYGFGMPLFIAGLAVFVAAFLLWLYGVKIYFTEYKVYNITAVYKNAKKYADIPYCEITDYQSEIEKIRSNYFNDTNTDKYIRNVNKLSKCKVSGKKIDCSKLLDLNVLKTGKIYYGCVAGANSTFYTPSYMNKYGIVFVVYSTDSYFDTHPEELAKISKGVTSGDLFSFYPDSKLIFNELLPKDVTGGREIIITSAATERWRLPMGYISGDIVPVIADINTSAFIVDCRYWTENLIGSYAFKDDFAKHGKFNEAKIALYKEQSCADYAMELKNIRDKYIADPDNEPVDFMGDNPFPMFTHSNTQVYYAYILYSEKVKDGKYNFETPAVAIYSTEDHFKTTPYAYTEIAENIRDNEKIYSAIKNIVNFKEHSVSPMVVPKTYTDGYNVIMTALFVDNGKLPTYRLTGDIIPVIYNEDEGGWIYSADSKYWSNGYTYEFVYGKKDS